MIVSDAGPIIIFARIGQLPLLPDITGSLLIADAPFNIGGRPDILQLHVQRTCLRHNPGRET